MATEHNTPFSAAPFSTDPFNADPFAGQPFTGQPDATTATADSHPFRSAYCSPAFRADTDQSGEWYVWTRIGRSAGPTPACGGWATMQRCESRELAQRLADDLNQRALRVAV